MNLSTLGQRIKKRREKNRLTQAQLANSLQITAQSVSKWERGENAPDIAILKPLAEVLGTSIDWILTGDEDTHHTFEATVFCSSIRNFAARSQKQNPQDLAMWINGFFTTLTEGVLSQQGVPVKYVGDGFLAYFSGANHSKRAFQAATTLCDTIADKNLLITLNTGDIYLGTIGHHDYAQPDIMGDTVNTAFFLNQWATQNSAAPLLITSFTHASLALQNRNLTERSFQAGKRKTQITVFEITTQS